MAAKKRRTQNYLNNANLLEQIVLSKGVWEKAKKKNPDATAASCITPELVKMLMMLVERYGQKANWRGYCVDESTECLTKRGWLDIDQLTVDDEILSYSEGSLVWSSIESIFRSPYEGDMFHLTVQGMDSLVTPGHKFVTDDGLKKVEHLKEKDRLILTGKPVESDFPSPYSDSFVELVGWVVTEGNYYLSEDRNYTRVTLFQNEGEYADRIRHCLSLVGGHTEYSRSRAVGDNVPVQVAFHLRKELCEEVISVAPNKIPTMDFLTSLSTEQRELLLNTMVDADGWRTNGYINYIQACKEHTNFFIALCTLCGYLTSVTVGTPNGYGKKKTYTVRVFATKKTAMVENVDFHGGKNTSRLIGQSKESYPNFPTKFYRGRVWCPKTEYGCFMARRNGKVHLTGNTYIEDMKAEALVSLLNGTLKFKPEVSKNPFGYMTQIVHHSFLTTLEKEKKVRLIRDDILEQNGFIPSHTRQLENESAMMERREREFYEETSGGSDDVGDFEGDED